MATQPSYRCKICHETFRTPKFAARCEGQGRPPLAYHVGDILFKGSKPGHLLVIRSSRVDHGYGKCPVDGPCEHAVSYNGDRLYPTYFGLERAWKAGIVQFAWQGIMLGHQRIATLNFPTLNFPANVPWGVISENGPPDLYLAGPRPEEGWARLWELWKAMQPKKLGRPRKDRQLPLVLTDPPVILQAGYTGTRTLSRSLSAELGPLPASF